MQSTVFVVVVVALLFAAALGASYTDLAKMVYPTVTCKRAQCIARVKLPIKNYINVETTSDIAVMADFEESDMAAHFVCTLNGTKIMDVEITGENGPKTCHSIGDNGSPQMSVCMFFREINSIGNSLQVCLDIGGGNINNPPNVLSMLGCFLADSQTSSMDHAILPRPPRPSAHRS